MIRMGLCSLWGQAAEKSAVICEAAVMRYPSMSSSAIQYLQPLYGLN